MEVIDKISILNGNFKPYNKLELTIINSKTNSELIESMKKIKSTSSGDLISNMITSKKHYYKTKVLLNKKKTKSGRNIEIETNKSESKKVLLTPLDLIISKNNTELLNTYIKLFHPTRNTIKSSMKLCNKTSECYNILKKQLDKEPLHKKLMINTTNLKIIELCKEYKQMSETKKQQYKSIYKKFCKLNI